jgi:hypothetical protein
MHTTPTCMHMYNGVSHTSSLRARRTTHKENNKCSKALLQNLQETT